MLDDLSPILAGLGALDSSLLILLGVGLLVGVLAAILGIGGGLVMVPVLTFWGLTPVQAVATSLVGVVLSSFSGTYQNLRTKSLQLERVVMMAPAAIVTTEFGVWAANAFSPTVLLIAFAALQFIAIWLMSLKNQLKKAEAEGKLRQVAAGTTENALIYRAAGIGAVAGALSGLFGVGGGVVMVPMQMFYLGESIKQAVRTSLGAVALISLWAMGRHALAGNVFLAEGLALGLGSLVGAQFGARLLNKLSDRLVNTLFRALLLILAVYMIVEALSF